jgi:hypothetical protein
MNPDAEECQPLEVATKGSIVPYSYRVRNPMKLVRLIKMCLNEIYNKVFIGKHLSDSFPIQNCLKQGDALPPLLFNFAVEYAIMKLQENQVGLKWNGTHQLPDYANDVEST